ncbi:MAG TPA: lantibiotic dehydratase [Candidatus Dormibacteraeota bacterium]
MSGWALGDVFVLRHAGFPFDWLDGLGWSEPALAAVDAVLDAETRGAPESERAALRAAAGTALESELDGLRTELRRLAAEPDVREAVFLSNPAVYENAWPRLVAPGLPPARSGSRRDERLAYTYLQRLCAKNETTSFFGPMGYGEIVEGDAFRVERRPTRRRTFVAFWVLQELVRGVNREPELRAHLPLARNPLFRFRAAEARSSSLGRAVAIDAGAAALLGHLDRGANSIAALAAAAGTSPAAVGRDLLPLLRGGALLLGIELPPDELDPFAALVAAVERLPALAARERWLERFRRLDELRRTFEGARLPERAGLLHEMESAFAAWTGCEPRRGSGDVYADRLVLYEEASSPFAIVLGRETAERLAASLSPALEVSAAYGAGVQREYAGAVAPVLAEAGGRLGLMEYLRRFRPDGDPTSRFSPVPPVRVPANGDPILLAAADGAGGARFALPDVALAAASAADLEAGSYRVVMARVHHHLLLWGWLATFHPDPERFDAVAGAWLRRQPPGQVIGLRTGRRNKGFYRFPGPTLDHGLLRAADGARSLPAEDFHVTLGEDGPELRSPAGRHLLYLALADLTSWPPLAALAPPLVLHAPIETGAAHAPRVMAGDSVYQRRRWRIAMPELRRARELDLCLEVRRLVRRHGLPRYVFVRVPNERKPCLIDLHSPFAQELLRHLGGTAGEVLCEEMLPGPGELWLQDERGRYTCELRMQAERR